MYLLKSFALEILHNFSVSGQSCPKAKSFLKNTIISYILESNERCFKKIHAENWKQIRLSSEHAERLRKTAPPSVLQTRKKQ